MCIYIFLASYIAWQGALEACIKGYFLPLLNPLGGLSLIYFIYKYYYYQYVLAGDIPVGVRKLGAA